MAMVITIMLIRVIKLKFWLPIRALLESVVKPSVYNGLLISNCLKTNKMCLSGYFNTESHL